MSRREKEEQMAAAARALKEEAGALSTFDQIANGSDYLSTLRNTEEDDVKEKVWRNYIGSRKWTDRQRICDEISIYRLIGQTWCLLVPDEFLDNRTCHELQGAVEHWVFLVVAGKLHLVLQREEFTEVKALKEHGSSPAEVFRAYVKTFKDRAGISDWAKLHMNILRRGIYEFVLHVREQGEREVLKESVTIQETRITIAKNNGSDNGGFVIKNEAMSDVSDDLYRASPPPAGRLTRSTARSLELAAQQSTAKASAAPARRSPRKSVLSNPDDVYDVYDASFLERLPAKISNFRRDLEGAEAKLSQKQEFVRELEDAAENWKTRFRNLERERQLADVNILDRREPGQWTSAALRRQANEVEKMAKLKREALLHISELIDREREAKAELKEAYEEANKHQEKMNKLNQLMELARELDKD